jgi:hypothetical protein
MSSSTAEIDDDEIIVVESSIEEEVDCWENERFYPFVGFSSRLLPTDRCPYHESLIPVSFTCLIMLFQHNRSAKRHHRHYRSDHVDLSAASQLGLD